MRDILFGQYMNRDVCYCTERAMNGNVTTTGISGSGKSVFNHRLSLEVVKNQGTVLAFSMNNTLQPTEVLESIRDEFFAHANVINVFNDGLCIPLFKHRNSSDEKERISDIGAVTEIFVRAYDLKSRQGACLRKAISEVYDRDAYHRYGIKAIAEILEDMSTSVSENVLEKMIMLFGHNVFKDGPGFIEKNKITIINLDGFDELTQYAVAEMVLSIIWRMAVSYEFKSDNLHIFIDEVQHLSLGKNSTLAKMLTEGRKMGLNLMLATQYVDKSATLSALLNQSDLQVFFKPARNDIRKVAALIDPGKEDDWTVVLKSLDVGILVAVGPLSVGGVKTRGPLIVNSRIDQESGSGGCCMVDKAVT